METRVQRARHSPEQDKTALTRFLAEEVHATAGRVRAIKRGEVAHDSEPIRNTQ